MENLSHTDEDYNLWLLLIKVSRAMSKARERELRKAGITPEQSGILYIIDNIGKKATLVEISRLTLREPHSVSYLVDRMEKAGLAKRVKDLSRKNMVRVAMTEKGQRAYKQAGRQTVHQTLSCLSEEERNQLRSYLGRLLDKATEVLAYSRLQL